MKHYMLVYSGIEGQAQASGYNHPQAKQNKKVNAADSLQDAIANHRQIINDTYNSVI